MRPWSSTALATALLALTAPSCRRGGRYESFRALAAAAAREGFAFVGRFGDHWPARVVQTREALGGIEFTAPGRGPQAYPGYDGWLFRLYILEAEDDGGRFAVVFRRRAADG